MKKILLSIAVASMTLLTGCDLIGKKSDDKGAEKTEQTPGHDYTEPGRSEPDEQEIPVPDNSKAEKIIAKYNQGPAINNIDYADALEYAEIYLSLTAGYIADAAAGDNAQREAAENDIHLIDSKYPYNAELIQILYQASALDKTEGGLVPMNDDNRARFEALVNSYDNIAR